MLKIICLSFPIFIYIIWNTTSNCMLCKTYVCFFINAYIIDFAHDYYIKWEILLYWFSIHHSLYCIPEITPPVKVCAIISPYLCFVQFWGLKAMYEKLESKDLFRTKAKDYGWTIHGFVLCYPQKHLSVLEETLLHFVFCSKNGEIKKKI